MKILAWAVIFTALGGIPAAGDNWNSSDDGDMSWIAHKSDSSFIIPGAFEQTDGILVLDAGCIKLNPRESALLMYLKLTFPGASDVPALRDEVVGVRVGNDSGPSNDEVFFSPEIMSLFNGYVAPIPVKFSREPAEDILHYHVPGVSLPSDANDRDLLLMELSLGTEEFFSMIAGAKRAIDLVFVDRSDSPILVARTNAVGSTSAALDFWRNCSADFVIPDGVDDPAYE